MSIDKLSIVKASFFVNLIKAGSYAQAARLMDVSLQYVYAELKALERLVNASLLEKHNHQLVLTPVGEKFLETCQKLLDARDAFSQDDSEELPKQLTIASIQGLAQTLLPPVLCRFQQEYPSIYLNIVAGMEYLDPMKVVADIFIGPAQTASMLTKHKILSVQYAWYASQEYIDRHGRPETIGDLKENHRVLLHTVDMQTFDLHEFKHLVATSNNLTILTKLCDGGSGIAILPIGFTRSNLYTKHKLVEISQDQVPLRDVYLRFNPYGRYRNVIERLRQLIIEEKESLLKEIEMFDKSEKGKRISFQRGFKTVASSFIEHNS